MRSEARALLAAMLASAALLLPATLASGRAPAVAIVLSSKIGPFEQATEGILAALRRGPLQPEILTFDLEGAREKTAAVLEQVRRAEPALVITVGSLATAAVLEKPWPVPVVFSMVLYPAQSGFVAGSGRKVTGASLDVPLEQQFKTLRRVLPAAHRLGVLCHAGETGAIVEAARKVAPHEGFTVETAEVAEPGAALGALGALLERVDAVWTVADSHVFTPQTTSALILAALRQRVPVFGLSVAHVRTGALAALYVDYADVGAQAGELAERVLGGEDAADIAPVTPRKVALALNLRTAEHLGVQIAPEVEKGAGEVVR